MSKINWIPTEESLPSDGQVILLKLEGGVNRANVKIAKVAYKDNCVIAKKLSSSGAITCDYFYLRKISINQTCDATKPNFVIRVLKSHWCYIKDVEHLISNSSDIKLPPVDSEDIYLFKGTSGIKLIVGFQTMSHWYRVDAIPEDGQHCWVVKYHVEYREDGSHSTAIETSPEMSHWVRLLDVN